MPITPDGEAPYTSVPAAVTVIDRFRRGTLQTPVTQDVLRRAGVPDGLVRRTLKALRLLELIDDSGRPTDQFQMLAKVRPDEYKDAFAGYLRSVYKDVFTYTDPAQGDIDAIRNAFWGYKPQGQHDAMVRLFLGLCDYAGLIPEQQKKDRPAPSPRKSKDTSTATRSRKRGGQGEGQPPPTPPPPPPPAPSPTALDGIDPALVAWFQKIPRSGTPWAAEDKERWFTAFRAMVNGVHPEPEKN